MIHLQPSARLPTAILVLLAITSLTPAPTASAEAFTTTHHLAEPMVDPATVWTGEEALLMGGRNATGPVDTIQTYDPSTGKARVLDAKLPQRTHGATAVWTGDAAYLFGGAHLIAVEDPTGTADFVAEVEAHDTIVRVDPHTGNVTTLSDRLPEAAFGMASVWTGDAAYLYGGVNRTIQNDTGRTDVLDWILRFDPTAPEGDRVQRVGSLPAPFLDLHAAWSGSSTLLMGGWVETRTEDGDRVLAASDRVLRHDPGASGATLLEPRLPTTLRWAGTATVNGSAYLFGGCQSTCDDAATTQLETVVRVNLTTAAAERLHPTLPAPRIAPGAVTTPDGILVVGGGRGRDRYDVVFDDVLTFEPGPTPPLAPRNLSLQGTQAGVEVTWDPPTYDGGANLTGYQVERARPGSGFTPVVTVPANGTDALDPTAPPDVNLTYRVRALNPEGLGEPGLAGNVTAPPRPPSEPQHLEALGIPGAVLLRWSAPATDGGRDLGPYQVHRDGTPVANVTDTRWTDANLTGNGSHVYTVHARNSIGFSTAAGPVSAGPEDRLPPPRNVTLRASGTAVDLTWDPPTAGPVTHYQVLAGPTWDTLEPLQNTTDTSFQTEGLAPGEVRWFAVAAVNATGPGAPSQAQRAVHVVPPGPPRDLAAEPGPGRVVLKWASPQDTGGAEEIFYLVTRQRVTDEDPVFINPDRWTETSLRDDEAPPGETVTYRVRAVNAAGTGPETNLTVEVPRHNQVPVARLSTSSLRAHQGELVGFDASASHDPDGRIVRVSWSFGDGAATGWVTSLQALHRYDAPGNYTVQVQVRDDHGAVSHPANATVVVSPPPDRQEEPTDPTGPVETEPTDPSDDGFLGVPGPTASPTLLALVGVALLTMWRERRR